MYARRIFQCPVHLPHRADDEEIDVGRVEQRQHPCHAADAVDKGELDGSAERAGKERLQHAAVRRGKIDPADCAYIWRQEEGHQIENFKRAPTRHIGARNHPSQAESQNAADDGGTHTAQCGVADRLIEPRIAEEGREVLQRQRRSVAIPIEQAPDDGGEERADNEQHSDNDAACRQGILDKTPPAPTGPRCVAATFSLCLLEQRTDAFPAGWEASRIATSTQFQSRWVNDGESPPGPPVEWGPPLEREMRSCAVDASWRASAASGSFWR